MSARETAHARSGDIHSAYQVLGDGPFDQDFPGTGYDFVCIFDALHDMGDPVGAACHIRDALADDGTWMLVEPIAIDGRENNVNPVSRIFEVRKNAR